MKGVDELNETLRILRSRANDGAVADADAGLIRDLVVCWAALLSAPSAARPHRLFRSLSSALSRDVRGGEMSRAQTLTYMLDFALSPEADSVLRVAPRGSSTWLTLSAPANLLVAASFPRVAEAARKLGLSNGGLGGDCDGKGAEAPTAKVPKQSAFVNPGHVGNGRHSAVSAPVFSAPDEMESEERSERRTVRDNRREFTSLVASILHHSPESRSTLVRLIEQRTCPVSPLPSFDQYMEMLPRQPMYERDVYTRKLFSQNPILYDLILVATDPIVHVSPSTTAPPLPLPLYHTVVCLLASAVAAWNIAPQRSEFMSLSASESLDELIESTVCVVAVLRRAKCLPWPMSHVDEVVASGLSPKSVSHVLWSALRFVMQECPNGAPSTPFPAESVERCSMSLRRVLQSSLTSGNADQYVRFFSEQQLTGML